MKKIPNSAFKKGQIPHNLGLRNEAKLRGDAHYFTGQSCKNGHISKRLTSNGSCMECCKINAAKRRKKQTLKQKDEVRKKSAARSALWRQNNPDYLDRHRECKIKYKKSLDGRSKNRVHLAKRRIVLLERTISQDEDDLWMIEEIYHLAALRNQMFGFQWHVDHIVPLQGKTISGLHVPNNLRVIPWLDNLKKGNKYLEAERG
jgi:hypothetical protein